jgi:hypothetical protein
VGERDMSRGRSGSPLLTCFRQQYVRRMDHVARRNSNNLADDHLGRTGYPEGLAQCCLEAARNPRLLGMLAGILRLAPRTIVELAKPPCG